MMASKNQARTFHHDHEHILNSDLICSYFNEDVIRTPIQKRKSTQQGEDFAQQKRSLQKQKYQYFLPGRFRLSLLILKLRVRFMDPKRLYT